MSHAPEEQFNTLIDSTRNSNEFPRDEFVKKLEARLYQHVSKRSMQKNIWQRVISQPMFPFGALAVIVLGIGLLFTFQSHSNTNHNFKPLVLSARLAQADFEMTPTKSDVLGVDADTSFTLTTKQPFERSLLESSLAFVPAVDFAVQGMSDTEYAITPTQPLEPGRVYQLTLSSEVKTDTGLERQKLSWAYQSKDELRISGTLPRDKASGVPIDTGIELTFNTARFGSPEQFFTILPATSGRFERHGRVLAFIPSERLKPSTLYTVTMRKGLTVDESSVTLSDDVVVRFETAGAENSTSDPNVLFSDLFTAFRPGESPIIDLSYSYGYQPSLGTLSATVYSAETPKRLIDIFAPYDTLPEWAYLSRRNFVADTTSLTKVATYQLTQEGGAAKFPNGFDAGLYVIDLQYGKDKHATIPLVISDIAVSLTMTSTDSVAWVYDLQTKKPIEEASVHSVFDDKTTTTDADGIARFATPKAFSTDDPQDRISRSYVVISLTNGSQTISPLVAANTSWYSPYSTYGNASGKYWSYLWLDRTLYRPDDTINLWGVARSRQDPAKEDVTVEVSSWDYVDANGERTPLLSHTVSTGEYSTFTDSLNLHELKPGYYSMVAKVGSMIIGSRNFQVQTFTKPAFRITATPDHLVVFAGDEVTYTVETNFFDGTPAPHIKLSYSGYGIAEAQTVTTDEVGKAQVKITMTLTDDYSKNYGVFAWASFSATLAAEGDIGTDASVFVHPATVTFAPESIFENGTLTISSTVRSVDASQETASWWIAAMEGKPVPNTKVAGTVYEVINEKTKIGEHYDFIEKKVVDQYNYSTREEKRETFSALTDKNGYFEKQFTLDGEAYRVELQVTDPQGRTITRSAYAYANGVLSSGVPNYIVSDTKNNNEYTSQGKKYDIGEETTLRFTKDGKPVSNTGKFLFLKLQSGLKDTKLSDSDSLKYVFDEADAPNVFFAAVWFDGNGFRATSVYNPVVLNFDESNKSLNVDISTVQDSYAPGETAKLRVNVTGPDGKGRKAIVNLSAIDESINAIQWDNTPSPLTTLYRKIEPGMLEAYVSHDVIRLNSEAEGGGGGGDARINFKDAILFTEVETNSAGQATVDVRLPDNLTTWRVVGQALTKELETGFAVGGIVVSKPLFGTMTMNDEFVVSDAPSMIASAYGASLKSDDNIDMTVEIPSLGYSEHRSTHAFSRERFNFPKLQVGTHEIRFTVRKGSVEDILVRSFSVVSSRLSRYTNTFIQPVVGEKIPGSTTERSTLIISDTGRGRIITTLQSLAWAYGKRLDRNLAAQTAIELLKQLDESQVPADIGFDPSRYQQDDGGISLTVYGSSDPELSAMAAARSDLFDVVRLEGYFTQILQKKDASLEEIGNALLGLAFMKQPVISDIDAYLTFADITDEHRLTAALAYAALGLNDKAGTLAADLLAHYGETQDPYIRLKLGDTEDAKILNTARFAILAEVLQLPQRLGIAKYLSDNFPKDALTNLERSVAAQFAVPLLDTSAVSLTYAIDGVEHTVNVEGGHTNTISVSSDELAALSIVDVKGPVGITVFSTEPIDQNTATVDKRISIRREFSAFTGTDRQIDEGDIVKVTLFPSVSKGVIGGDFLVTDELPSGLVFESAPWSRNLPVTGQGYPVEVSGQRLTFHWNTADGASFYYYARVLMPGGFNADPVTIQNVESRDVVNYSAGQSIEIH